MLFFMLFEGYLVKMWYIACIPDSGRPDRPTRPDPTRPSRTDPTDRPSLRPAADAERTFNFAPPHSQHLSFMYTHNTEPQEAPQAADFLHACAHGANFRATEQSQGLRFNTSPFGSPAFQLWLVALLAQSSILQREKSDPVS